MSQEHPDYISLAVEHVLRLPDAEWSNRLVHLIQRVNAEAFKTCLLEAHEQKRDNRSSAKLQPKEKWLPGDMPGAVEPDSHLDSR